ncbi:MAG TPA: CxxxxCH/CxxCH domain-containing protein, partial [Geobacteraceae bacterium]|nr:CxxxxCH/CxxCH domain-containing protein [Geobacteraceae bacterium]
MVHDKITNALGNDPLNYGAHAIHNNTAKMTCAACHNTTNHGLETTAWVGDRILEMGFTISKDTFNGFNPNQSIQSGTFYGTQFLSSPYVWSAGPGTTIVQTADYNASCSTYCHGNWPGNSGSVTTPIWVGTGQAACGTCHNASGEAPPTSGSHTKHAANFGAGLGIACSKCHGAFSNFTGVGHINGKVQWDLSAYPGATYNGSPANSTGAPAPTASANFATCNTLYCHSDVQGKDGNGTGGPSSYKVAKWGDPTTATCGSCHADPNISGSHPSHENVVVAFDCHVCHDNGGTTSPLNHANGIIDFQFVGLGQNTVYSRGTAVPAGTGYGTCSTSNCHGRFTRAWGTASTGLTLCDKCHGSATSPRGFYNTQGPDGTLSIYSAAIGVHDIHLQNPNSPRKATFARFTSYAKGFSCRQCHAVPDGPFASGHIDTALPAEVPFSHVSSIANTGKTKFSYYTSPSYNIATQTCSAVWCHGAGMNSNNSSGPYAGVPGSIQRQNPKWDTPYLTGNGTVDCVKCHALPPPAPDSSYIHYGQTMANCKECHTNLTNDGLGFKDKSLHVNGKIDGGCTNCHGYPPITDVVGAADGLATPAQGALQLGTAGAHSAHVLNANIGKKCQTCHNNYTIAMPSNNLEIGFNGLNGTVTSGTFTGYSNSGVHPNWVSNSAGTIIQKVTAGANVCSNLYCHGGGTATLPALGGGSNTAPNWEGGSADAVCGSCHGADIASVPTGGSHAKHALATGGGPGINCNACHRSVTDMSHVDGTVSWYLDHDNPVIGVNATYDNLSAGRIVGLAPRNNGADYRNCNNVYCHSNVQGTNGIGAPTSYATVKWGSGTLDCGSCHKNMATDGAATGSHVKHANTGASNMALSCGYCHQ